MLYKCEMELELSSFHASCEDEVTKTDMDQNYHRPSLSSMALICYHTQMISEVPTAMSVEIIGSSRMW
jgi:hypothetical protein